jgi:hypothetical protein
MPRRWLKSTSNRTFIVWPVALFALEALVQQGVPIVYWWGLPLLAWGYLQYRLVGNYRARTGGGGPGISIPPDRIVDGRPLGAIRCTVIHLLRWHRHHARIADRRGRALVMSSGSTAREDEGRLEQPLGEPCSAYCRVSAGSRAGLSWGMDDFRAKDARQAVDTVYRRIASRVRDARSPAGRLDIAEEAHEAFRAPPSSGRKACPRIHGHGCPSATE